MESLILFILGLCISLIFIILGLFVVYYNNKSYEKTIGIIDKAKCALNRDIKNFVYNCEIKIHHIIGNKKYINFKNVKTTLVPYRKYDKIDIWYNKNDPTEIIINEDINNYYIYIPIVMGIILLILTITLYLIISF